MKIKGSTVRQGNARVFAGVMKVKDLLNGIEVDQFMAGHPDGYQRSLSGARARAFGRFIIGDGLSPTSILINIRDGEITEDPPGTLNLPDDTERWIVDGQHRIEGLRFAVERDSSVNEFEFPVVFMNQKSNYEEAKQFVVINKTQKGVRTDLAERFLMRAVRDEGRNRLVEMREAGALRGILKNIEWVTKAVEIADILNLDKTHVWYGKIRLPNEPKDGTTVAQKSFTDSLEPVLKDSFFQGKSVQPISAALGNYWDAIAELCEAAFESPSDYVIQRTTGVFVLHKIFPRISELCHDDKGNRLLRKEKIKSVLEGLPFMNSHYWSNSGPAGQRGTSQKAFALIAIEALESLEKRKEMQGPDIVV
jgi:DGQHR domain-containing protein